MPEYTATHKFARISPRKIRLVLDMVRGREVDDALNILRFAKQRGSVFVERAVKSAVANYYDQQTTPGQETLIISEARADEGPTIKRFQPKDRGKAHSILKRTSHVILSVSDGDND